MEKWDIPETIYMQYYQDEHLGKRKNMFYTWCEDRVFDNDLEYILKSEYEKQLAEKDEMIERLERDVDLKLI